MNTKNLTWAMLMVAATAAGCSESHKGPGGTDSGTDGSTADGGDDGGGDAGALSCTDRLGGSFERIDWNWGGFCREDCGGRGTVDADGHVWARENDACKSGTLSAEDFAALKTALADGEFIESLCSEYDEVVDYSVRLTIKTSAGTVETGNIVGAQGNAHATWSALQDSLWENAALATVDCPAL